MLTAAIVVLTAAFTANAQVAGNPPYTLNQSVIAGGGGTSADAGNGYSITGAIGQSIADTSSASPFTIKSGFFTAALINPTAATVTVGGRVTTSSGRGIRNVVISMSDSNGTLRIATSATFGYFTFTDVPAGDTYIFSLRAKRFRFSEITQVRTILEDVSDVNFIAGESSIQR